jgi:hypothetical protein
MAMLKVIGGLVGILLAAGVMVTSQGITTEGADTTNIGAEIQHLEQVNPEWTAYEAAIWVQHNIREHLNSCTDIKCFLDDPVLYEFNWDTQTGNRMPPDLKPSLAELISNAQVRDAWFYGDCHCWLVQLRIHPEDRWSYSFWTWESDRWVESFIYNEHYGN